TYILNTHLCLCNPSCQRVENTVTLSSVQCIASGARKIDVENDLIARLTEVLKDKNYRDIALDFVVEHVREAIKGRTIKAFHVNKQIPNGYEDQGAFNLLIVTAGHHIFVCGIGADYIGSAAIAFKAIS